MQLSTLALLTAVTGFAGGVWFWYAFSWRWYPGFPVLVAGITLAGFSGALCVLGEALALPAVCTNYRVSQFAGLALGATAAGVVILVASPFVAFWRRALETSRREA
jgi:hypothetical protein